MPSSFTTSGTEEPESESKSPILEPRLPVPKPAVKPKNRKTVKNAATQKKPPAKTGRVKKKLVTQKATLNRQPRPNAQREQPSRCDLVLREAQVSDKFATDKLKSTECSPARFLMLCNASSEFSKPEYSLARFIASRAAKISALGAKFRIQHPLQSSDLAGDYILLATICKMQKTRWWCEGYN